MSQSRATSVPPAQSAPVDPGPAVRRRLASAAPAGPSGAGGDVGEDPGDPMDLDEDDDGKGKGKGKAPDKGGEKKGKKGKKRREDDGDGGAGERAGGSGEQGEDMEVEEVEPEPKKKRAAVEKSEKAKEKAKAAQEDEDVAMAYEGGSDDDEGSSKPSGKRVGKKTTLEDVMAHEKFKRRQALEEEKMKTMAKKARLGMAKFLLTDEAVQPAAAGPGCDGEAGGVFPHGEHRAVRPDPRHCHRREPVAGGPGHVVADVVGEPGRVPDGGVEEEREGEATSGVRGEPPAAGVEGVPAAEAGGDRGPEGAGEEVEGPEVRPGWREGGGRADLPVVKELEEEVKGVLQWLGVFYDEEAGDESLWKFLSQNERKASLPETEMEMTARILESVLNGEDDQWERMRWVYDEWKDKVMEQTGDTTNVKTPRGMLQRMLKRPFYVDPAMILVRFTYFKAHSILRPAVWSKTHQENHPTILSTLLRTFGLGLRFICSPAPVTTRDKSRKVVKVFRRWFGQMLAPAEAREKSEDLAEVDLFVQDVEDHLRDDARNVGKTFNPAPDPNYDICSKEVLEEMERLWLEAMVKEEDGAFNVVKEGAHIAYRGAATEPAGAVVHPAAPVVPAAAATDDAGGGGGGRVPPEDEQTGDRGADVHDGSHDPPHGRGKDSVTDPVGVFSLSLCNRGMVSTVQKANLAITTGILRSIHSDIPLLHRAAFINIPPALSFFFSRSDRTTLKDRLTGAGWASFEADGTFVSAVLENKTKDVVKAEVEALRAFLLGVMSKTSASQKKTKGKGRGKGKGKEEFTPSGLDPQFSSDDVAAHPSVCLLVSSCSSFLMTKTTSNNKRDAEHLAPYVYFVYHAWKNVFLRFLAHDFCVRARNAVRDELSEVLTAFKFDMTVNLAKEGQAQVAALEMKRVYTFVDEHPLAAKTRKASCKPFADVEGKSGEVEDPADEAAAARAERLRPLLTESRQSFNTMLSKLRAVNGAVDIHAEKGRPFYSFVADPLEQLFRGVAIGLAFEDFLEHAGPDEVFVADEQGPYATVNIARTAPHPRFLWTRKTDDSAPPAVAPSNDMSAPAASPVPAPTPAPAPSAAAVAGPSKPTPPSPPAVTPNAQAGPSKPSAKATAARKKRASPSSSSGSSESESSTEEREEEAPAADRHESGNDSQESEEKGDSEDDEMKEDNVVGDDEADADEDEDEEDPSSHSKSRRRRSKRLSRVKSSLPPSEEDEPPEY
ncbi:hypothetical protein BXZ70DRAFT_1041768 [Cristinia sonorae]|uniref:Uncharacterized protein n=1 Tax=Cristinia sonorae TaxID=1940300 RepID=A0A8K0UIQ7_9AGAR|nr:hypothetical protein BXZ70DRAFT_1041768 [Cristinia sonorae]